MQSDAKAVPPSAGTVQGARAEPPKMKRKAYEREMRILHGQLVAMQEWVKESGAKVCIVFEAGHGLGVVRRSGAVPCLQVKIARGG
jgi:polyphosphate kinase 2 (PPK2 family)